MYTIHNLYEERFNRLIFQHKPGPESEPGRETPSGQGSGETPEDTGKKYIEHGQQQYENTFLPAKKNDHFGIDGRTVFISEGATGSRFVFDAKGNFDNKATQELNR
ncbi:hypothetical protein HZC21_05650 [Candidatus Peregrinibacteria bacterium]|nr:hypothetical protein [Candidatus Peregrinibacteria bacterium]